MGSPLADLERIFRFAVDRVDPEKLICDSVFLEKNRLHVQTPDFSKTWDLDGFNRILVLGFGKGGAKMAGAVEGILKERITDGVVCVKYGHTMPLERVRLMEAGHPIPDENGVAGAWEIARLAQSADEKTLVLVLISGGGSALIPLPYSRPPELNITLEEKQAVTRALLQCGAVIQEINCLRKHMSAIKGGRLAKMLQPATVVSLILSDVVGDSLDAIASGPTAPDNTTFTDAVAIVEKYEIGPLLPPSVRDLFDRGLKKEVAETPKTGDPAFDRVDNVLVGTNYLSLKAAEKAAADLGYTPVILSSRIIGEAREVARVYCGLAKDARQKDLLGKKPLCLIAGGETTVTLRGNGKGGRNQEMALSFLYELSLEPQQAESIWFLAASTDGTDGPTDAAGAFAGPEALLAARKNNLDILAYLKNNDAYSFFQKTGFLLKTGPTNTNVCDIQLIALP